MTAKCPACRFEYVKYVNRRQTRIPYREEGMKVCTDKWGDTFVHERCK